MFRCGIVSPFFYRCEFNQIVMYSQTLIFFFCILNSNEQEEYEIDRVRERCINRLGFEANENKSDQAINQTFANIYLMLFSLFLLIFSLLFSLFFVSLRNSEFESH